MGLCLRDGSSDGHGSLLGSRGKVPEAFPKAAAAQDALGAARWKRCFTAPAVAQQTGEQQHARGSENETPVLHHSTGPRE